MSEELILKGLLYDKEKKLQRYKEELKRTVEEINRHTPFLFNDTMNDLYNCFLWLEIHKRKTERACYLAEEIKTFCKQIAELKANIKEGDNETSL